MSSKLCFVFTVAQDWNILLLSKLPTNKKTRCGDHPIFNLKMADETYQTMQTTRQPWRTWMGAGTAKCMHLLPRWLAGDLVSHWGSSSSLLSTAMFSCPLAGCEQNDCPVHLLVWDRGAATWSHPLKKSPAGWKHCTPSPWNKGV